MEADKENGKPVRTLLHYFGPTRPQASLEPLGPLAAMSTPPPSNAFTLLMTQPQSSARPIKTGTNSAATTPRESHSPGPESGLKPKRKRGRPPKVREVAVPVRTAVVPVEPEVVLVEAEYVVLKDGSAESEIVAVETNAWMVESGVGAETDVTGTRRSQRISGRRERIIELNDLSDEEPECIPPKKQRTVGIRGRRPARSLGPETTGPDPTGQTAPLASIFTKGAKTRPSLPVLDPERMAARKAFLMSSAPEGIVRSQPSTPNIEEAGHWRASFLPFPTVSHIRQLDGPGWANSVGMPRDGDELTALGISIKIKETYPNPESAAAAHSFGLGYFTQAIVPDKAISSPELTHDEPEVLAERMSSVQIYHLVKSLRMVNDGFPIRKLFRRYVERKLEADTLEAEVRSRNLSLNDIAEQRLRSGRRLRRGRLPVAQQGHQGDGKPLKDLAFDASRPSSMQWTMKYTPQTMEDMIGNANVVKRLHTWLTDWRGRTPAQRNRPKLGKRKKLDDSFVVDFSDADSMSDSSEWSGSRDSHDETEDTLCNTAVLSGPSGIGKTSCVYALARQMGFKVLEVNASSVRGGRQVVAQLHEATQSHHLTKHEHKKQQKKNAPGERAKKIAEKNGGGEESQLKKTALILFEDIDLVFEDHDDGFYGAVINLIATTKRPIILTTSNPHFNARKTLKSSSIIDSLQFFEFKPVASQLIASYLQLMALAEGVAVDVSSISNLVALNHCIISKSILELQYWALSKTGGPWTTPASPEEALQQDPNLKDATSTEDSLAKLMSINKQQLQRSTRPQKNSHSSSSFSSTSGRSGLFAPVRPFSGCDLALMGLRDEQETSHLQQPAPKVQQLRNNVEHLWRSGYGDIYEQNCHLFLGLPTLKSVGGGQKTQRQLYPLASDNRGIIPSSHGTSPAPVALWSVPSSSKRYRRIKHMDLDSSIFAFDSDEDEEEASKSPFKDSNIADKENHEDSDRKLTGNSGDPVAHSCRPTGTTCPKGFNETEELERGKKECPLSTPPRSESEKMAFKNARLAIKALSNCAETNSHFSTRGDRPPWWALDNSFVGGQEAASAGGRLSQKLLARDDSYSQLALIEAIAASVQQMTVNLAAQEVQDRLPHLQGDELSVEPSSEQCPETSSSPSDDGASLSMQGRCTNSLASHLSKETLNSFLSDLTTCPRPHLMDTMPVIRGMARLEEYRKAGGGAKKSRSGRFLHYFDAQDLHLKPLTLIRLCNSFL